jgi:hypothetical protein
VEPWRREEDRDGMREVVCGRQLGCRHPEDAHVGGGAAFCSSCCSSCWSCYRKLQLLLELLQFLSVLQNADADRVAAFARDSLIMNSKIAFLLLSIVFPLLHNTFFCSIITHTIA